MAKIIVCDPCKFKGKIVQTHKYRRVKGRPDLRMDVCPECDKGLPKSLAEYAVLCYKYSGISITLEQARQQLQRR